MSPANLTRRTCLKLAGAAWLGSRANDAFANADPDTSAGLVIGQTQGAAAGMRVLADGGNAVDAAVAAALVAGVVALPACGIAGYGGHMVIGTPAGKVTAIDFNSAAPAAAREDMYPLDADGRVRDKVNLHGWLAAGVPGTLAGLQMALDLFGTRRLGQVIEPAIRFARDGFAVNAAQAKAIGNAAGQFARDPGSARLFLADGKPLAEGATFRNPDLARLLEKLAGHNFVADFYRGETARHIATEFRKHGGLVTESDLATYEAREVAPLSLEWRGTTILTAPLTAGGLSVLQSLATLKALGWASLDPDDPKTTQARIEAMRLAWHDRLALLGDPRGIDVPIAKLLSPAYAEQSAARVRDSVARQQLISGTTDGRPAGGTVHLTAADRGGMLVALTLTHGESFGAQVTVDGLGLVLGHGMSRFDPRPGQANSPRPGSRPLNNMCPTLLVRDGRPIAALGATGGRRIPNTLHDVLVHLVGRGASLADAAAAPRLHTEGDATLFMAKGWSQRDQEYLRKAGYNIQPGAGANLNAIARDPQTAVLTSAP